MALLGAELIPVVDEAWDTLERVCNKEPVNVQKVLELLTVRHCSKMGNQKNALFVAHHINRHVEQVIKQLFEQVSQL